MPKQIRYINMASLRVTEKKEDSQALLLVYFRDHDILFLTLVFGIYLLPFLHCVWDLEPLYFFSIS